MADHIREEIGTYEVKTHLAEILRRVERGESFIITHRGRAVAELTPAPKLRDAEKTRRAIESLLKNQLPPVSDEAFSRLLKEGRKY